MGMEDVLRLIKDDVTRLESEIVTLITTRVPFISEVAQHIIKSGGKRIRPILVILSARLCGYKGDDHIEYAAIVEFIHTATLLHDDVVDRAMTRRGMPTANRIWGNQPSVHVGDFLFTKAFDLMVRKDNAEVLKVMARATTELAEGEILEFLKTSDIDTTEEEYFEVITNKTAVLLAAACEIGAILSLTNDTLRSSLRQFGHDLGIAFQLTDDILDYTSSDETLGKHTGTDLKEGKLTLPLIHALRTAGQGEKDFVAHQFTKSRITKKDFKSVKKVIERHGGIDYTLRVSTEYIRKAKECLSTFPPSPHREALFDLADHVLTRRA